MEVSGAAAVTMEKITGSVGKNQRIKMKRLILYLIIAFCLMACTDGNTGISSANDSLTAAKDSLPFWATYSADFIPGNQSNVALVMKVFKAWENNDMKVIKARQSEQKGNNFLLLDVEPQCG
jgi:hypothetical protein